MRWIWIRHGETADNSAGLFLGHHDAPLNERGILQATELAQQFADQPISHLFSSDLLRAVETARLIGQAHDLQPVPAQALRELSFGRWERKSYDELMKTDRRLLERWYLNPLQIAPPEGETLQQMGMRFDRWLHGQIGQLKMSQTILCVTHGGPIRWFRSKWMNGDETAFWQTEGVACGNAVVADWDGTEWRYT